MNQSAMPKPVDWDQLYPGRFMKAGELLGKQVTLTIKSVDLDELEGDKGKKVKGIVSFNETPKQLALNRTNGTCLREMFGRAVQEWIGKKVTIHPGEWNGEPCIRVYGSPDIASDMQIEVALPRRRPIPMVMRAMKPRAPQSQQRAQQDNGQQRPSQGGQQRPAQAQQRPVPRDDDGEPPPDVRLPGQDDDAWQPGRE